jgi:Ubiquitin-2 like Rad60 SUMO-like
MTKEAERDSLLYVTSPTSHISTGGQEPGVSAPESASREASIAPEDDTDVIKLFLRCRARPEPLRLSVRASARCGKVIDAYLKKLAKEGIVPQNRQRVRIELDGEEVDGDATIESLEVEHGDQLDVGGM